MVDVIWTMTGMILLGAMIAGGISLFLKRRKESISNESVSAWTEDLRNKESSVD